MGISKYGEPLTLMEVETMRRLAMGIEVKKLAREVGVTPNAITNRIYRASIKLGTRGMIPTIMMGYLAGYYKLPPIDSKLIHTSCGE